ncbi:hypothetical protein GA0115246_107292 [Streptomyces sp. SolWspMP-sol7th]|nr:hypothetical protein GA0115246_107292 [Streptomyces sp. SolWspMP-sol7th]
MEPGADGGTQAVGAYQGERRLAADPAAASQGDADPLALALVEADDGGRGADRVGAESGPYRLEEEVLEDGAVDAVLRHGVPQAEAPRLAPQVAAVPVVVGEDGGGDGVVGEGLAEAERGEFGDGAGRQAHAGARGQRKVGGLDDGSPDTGGVQGEREGEAADPGP